MMKSISSKGRSFVKKRIAFCFLAACVSVLALAGCEGADGAQKEARQAQQEPNQQVAQSTPSKTQSGSALAAPRLVGTWELTSVQGNPVPAGPGTMSITFTSDGTFESHVSPDDSPGLVLTARYSVLDDSRIRITPRAEDGPPYEQDYSLSGDTLTLTGLEGVLFAYQRTG